LEQRYRAVYDATTAEGSNYQGGKKLASAVDAVDRAKHQLAGQAWNDLIANLVEKVGDARTELEGFVSENTDKLLEEHEADAERVHKAYTKAYEEARKVLAPLEEEHAELKRSQDAIIGRTEPFTSESVPSDPRSKATVADDARAAQEKLAAQRKAAAEGHRQSQAYKSIIRQEDEKRTVSTGGLRISPGAEKVSVEA
jgi:hypothetical protein